MNPFAAPSYLAPFVLIVDWLRASVLMQMGRHRVDAGMAVAIRLRLRKLETAFARLVEKVAQGKYVVRVRKPRENAVKPPEKEPEPGALPKLPTRFGWLYYMMRPEASHTASQLQNWLQTSGVAELVQNVPQAGRILRPIAHIVGLKSDVLALPKKPHAQGCDEATGADGATGASKKPRAARPKAEPAAWPYKPNFKRCEVEPGHTFPPMGPDAEERAARLAASHAERRRRKREKKAGYSPA